MRANAALQAWLSPAATGPAASPVSEGLQSSGESDCFSVDGLECPRADRCQWALRLAAEHPTDVVATPSKADREGRVFIDWSQNSPGKSTVAPYSLRASREPVVSMPLAWDEVERAARGGSPAQLDIAPAEAIRRLERTGDLFGPLVGAEQRLPNGAHEPA